MQSAIYTAFLQAHNIPVPIREYGFHPDRRWRFDFAWPALKIALEVEGGIYGGKDHTGRQYKGAHSSVSGIKRDISKYNAAALLGWLVLRVQPADLDSQETIDMIKAAFLLKGQRKALEGKNDQTY